MKKQLSKWEPEIYALLRIVTGFLFFWHGFRKFFEYPNVGPEAPMWVIVIGGTIQAVGGALITLGIGTRLSAFLGSGMMAIGYWIVFGTESFLPIVNGGELAVMFCFALLYIAARGNGDYSIASAIGRQHGRGEIL